MTCLSECKTKFWSLCQGLEWHLCFWCFYLMFAPFKAKKSHWTCLLGQTSTTNVFRQLGLWFLWVDCSFFSFPCSPPNQTEVRRRRKITTSFCCHGNYFHIRLTFRQKLSNFTESILFVDKDLVDSDIFIFEISLQNFVMLFAWMLTSLISLLILTFHTAN